MRDGCKSYLHHKWCFLHSDLQDVQGCSSDPLRKFIFPIIQQREWRSKLFSRRIGCFKDVCNRRKTDSTITTSLERLRIVDVISFSTEHRNITALSSKLRTNFIDSLKQYPFHNKQIPTAYLLLLEWSYQVSKQRWVTSTLAIWQNPIFSSY